MMRFLMIAFVWTVCFAPQGFAQDVPTVDTVQKSMAALGDRLAVDHAFTFEGQEVYTTSDQDPTRMPMRGVFERRGDMAAGILAQWDDGKLRDLPTSAAIRDVSALPPGTFITRTFADAEQLFVYAVRTYPSPTHPPHRSASIHPRDPATFAGDYHDRALAAAIPIAGYTMVPGDRLIDLIAKANNLRVRPNRERVDGAECIVVEFANDTGSYVVWLDPLADWQPRRAEVQRRSTDRVGNQLLYLQMNDRYAERSERYDWSDFDTSTGVARPTRFVGQATDRLRSRPGQTRSLSIKRTMVSPAAMPFDVWSTTEIPEGLSVVRFAPGAQSAERRPPCA